MALFSLSADYNEISFNIGDKKFRIPLDAFHQKPDPANFGKQIRTIDRSQLKGDKSLKLSKEQTDAYRDFILGSDDSHLGGKFFEAFISKDILMDQIFTIIANRSMLQDLRENFKNPQIH